VHPQASDVVNLAEHLGSRIGEACGGVDLVADRRGSRVYRLQFPTGDVALKLASHNSDEQGVREAENLARREAAVLTHLHDFIPGYLIDSGDLDGGGSWLALRWRDGITPHRLFTPARQGDDSPARRDSILYAAVDIAGRLARLHALGWLHADLQPAHILLGPTTVHLIDFALAQGPDPLPSDVTYRGGMVHFTAPETAAHILATPDDQPIVIEECAEVYALAAVLHLAWTGLPPIIYSGDQAPWRDKLKDLAQGRQRDLAAIRPWPWPSFENALRHALTPEPENRIPSMTRFRDALSSPNTST
jgi:serine/threonine protein kinase